MHMLNGTHVRLPINPPQCLQTALTDIVNGLEFSSDFCIAHSKYQPWQLSADIVTRYQQLPLDIQERYLKMRLCDFLYGLYFDGSLKTILASDLGSTAIAKQPLENKRYLGVDQSFYQRLHANNQGAGYFDPDWLVLKEENEKSLAVIKNNLTLYIKRDRHLPLAEQSARVGDRVKILFPANQIESAYYIAIGNAGFPRNSHSDSARPAKLVSIYFNLSPEGAVAVMEGLTRQLNAIALPFTFRVRYNPADYDGYDPGILSFEPKDYPAVRPILQSVYRELKSHFRAEVPLFTKVLAPGLALAEEPDQKFFERDNFGRNRCQIVTNGLLSAYQKGNNSPQERMAEIIKQFALMGIELQHSYLNPKSEDIYPPLD